MADGHHVAIVAPPLELGGGTKELLLFARALASAGHRVDLVTADATKRKTFDYQGLTLTPDEALLGKKYDVAIATWYETIALAERLAPVAIHFCQGYEADLIHLSDKFEAIAEAYSRALPALVVSPHLAARLADRFATRCVVMPPLLDPDFRPRRFARGPGKRPRIILQGIFEAEVKRVRLGLEAFALLQKRLPSDLVRVSVLPLSKGERDCGVSSEFYSDVRPVEVAALTARSSLTLFTSTSAEGFGLPVLEGLAAGTPVVAVRIPSLAVFESMRVVEVAAEPDPAMLADIMFRLLTDPRRWRLARRRGMEFAGFWRKDQFALAAGAFDHLLAGVRPFRGDRASGPALGPG